MPKAKLKRPYKTNIEAALLGCLTDVVARYKDIYGVTRTARVISSYLSDLLNLKLFKDES